MADYNDDRQEYIPANRQGRPLQRPFSAHVSNRPGPPPGPGPSQKASPYVNGGPSPHRRIQSAAPYRPPRPVSANYQPPPVAAWSDAPSYGMGLTQTPSAPGLFAGMESTPPMYARPDNTRHVPSKEPENMQEELRKMRLALSGFKEQNRLLRTERQRLEEELGRARTNLVKAEELLNAREKALSPTIGLSQMYRTPETTALVARLKDQVKTLRAEKDRFKGDLEELLRSTKATRVAELQSEAHALGQELTRQLEMTAIMRYRMEEAEAMAAAAQRKAEQAEALARQFTEAGSALPQGPVRLAPGNTISSGRVKKTMQALQASHRVLQSQAELLRTVFPPGMTMEALAAKAALKAPTAGATEVLRYLRYHINKLNTELGGLPGGRPNEDDLAAATGSVAAKPPRPRPGRPRSAGCGPVGSGPADGSKPVEPSSDPRVLLQGVADLVRELRAMDMDSFMGRPDLEADVEALVDVAGLLTAEHKRLTGAGSPTVYNEDEEDDVNAQENPLYQPVPKSDLVPPEADGDEEEEEEEKYEDDFAADGYEDDKPEEEQKDEEALVAEGDSPDEAEAAAGKKPPPPLKESSSVRSLRSQRSAPDTPVKHQEGPASSIGDPSEYGLHRTSVAGSMYSQRGWQPEGGVLREEDDEPALSEIALAAATAVVVAEAVAEEEGQRGGQEEQEPAAETEPLLSQDDITPEAYGSLAASAALGGDEQTQEQEPEPELAAEGEGEGEGEDGGAGLEEGGEELEAATALLAGVGGGEEEEEAAKPPPPPAVEEEEAAPPAEDGDEEKAAAAAALEPEPEPEWQAAKKEEEEEPAPPAALELQVAVYTSDVRAAGTDSDIFITIVGDKGDTGERVLDNSRNNFERGTVETFTVTSHDIGPIQNIKIRSTGTGIAPDWHVDKIEITSVATGDKLVFPYANWVDKENGLEQVLYPAQESAAEVEPVVYDGGEDLGQYGQVLAGFGGQEDEPPAVAAAEEKQAPAPASADDESADTPEADAKEEPTDHEAAGGEGGEEKPPAEAEVEPEAPAQPRALIINESAAEAIENAAAPTADGNPPPAKPWWEEDQDEDADADQEEAAPAADADADAGAAGGGEDAAAEVASKPGGEAWWFGANADEDAAPKQDDAEPAPAADEAGESGEVKAEEEPAEAPAAPAPADDPDAWWETSAPAVPGSANDNDADAAVPAADDAEPAAPPADDSETAPAAPMEETGGYGGYDYVEPSAPRDDEEAPAATPAAEEDPDAWWERSPEVAAAPAADDDDGDAGAPAAAEADAGSPDGDEGYQAAAPAADEFGEAPAPAADDDGAEAAPAPGAEDPDAWFATADDGEAALPADVEADAGPAADEDADATAVPAGGDDDEYGVATAPAADDELPAGEAQAEEEAPAEAAPAAAPEEPLPWWDQPEFAAATADADAAPADGDADAGDAKAKAPGDNDDDGAAVAASLTADAEIDFGTTAADADDGAAATTTAADDANDAAANGGATGGGYVDFDAEINAIAAENDADRDADADADADANADKEPEPPVKQVSPPPPVAPYGNRYGAANSTDDF